MGKAINDLNFDLPDSLDSDITGVTAGPENRKPERRAVSQEGYEYKPSDYIISRLNAMPKEQVKKKTGIDIDYLIKNTRSYGVLEPLAMGEFTSPLCVFMGKNRSYACVRIYSYPNRPVGEDNLFIDMHPVQMKRVQDKENPERTRLVYDRNELKEGDVLFYGNEELTTTQMDHLRLTGHLGEPIRGVNFNGEPTSTLISVDPYNNHCLCAVSADTVRRSLAPSFRLKEHQEKNLKISANGCILDNGILKLNCRISGPDGSTLKNAVTGDEKFLVPVTGGVVKVGTQADNFQVNVPYSMVERLSASITYQVEDSKVVSFFTARQIGELAEGHGIWAGGTDGFSYILSGNRDKMTLTPIRDKGYAAHVQYDAARRKLVKTVDFSFAKRREVEMKNNVSRAQENAKSINQHAPEVGQQI